MLWCVENKKTVLVYIIIFRLILDRFIYVMILANLAEPVAKLRSRGTTKRRYFLVKGDPSQACVRIANQLARRICYLLELHYVKGVYYVLENPISSLLWKFRCVQQILARHGAKRVVVALGSMGANTLKPVICLHLFIAILLKKVYGYEL